LSYFCHDLASLFSYALVLVLPNVLALSRVDGCAGLGSVYFNRRQRTYQRRHQAEDHVGCCAGLGELLILLKN